MDEATADLIITRYFPRILLAISMLLGLWLGILGVGLLKALVPALCGGSLVWYIKRVEDDGPLILEQWDAAVRTMIPYLAFLATNYTIRINIFLMRRFWNVAKALSASRISLAALVTVLASIATWRLFHSRNDRSISISATFRQNFSKSLGSAELSIFVKVPIYIFVQVGWLLATMDITLRPLLRKLLGPLAFIKRGLCFLWQLLLSLVIWITMKIFSQDPKTNKTYQHSRINTKREIRLVILHRRLPFSPIRITLQHFHLEFVPPYEAISYTWGSAEKDSEILVRGHSFYITTSAFNVLRSRSSIWRTRVIWIDSICINQEDDAEKGQQVSLMGDIYRNCSRTIVWLGGWENFNMSFGGPSLIRDLVDRGWGISNMERHKKINDIRMFTTLIRLPALVKLLRHPWFERVWVVQEVALPKKVHVVYGGQYLEWHALEKIAEIFIQPEGMALLQMTAAERTAIVGITGISNMARIRGSTEAQGSINRLKNCFAAAGLSNYPGKGHEMLPLAELLKDFASLKSTNPLDKVYALLSLTSDGSNQAIVPDYRKSPQQLFTEVAEYIVSIGEPFKILSSAGVGHERKYDELPSWVPDWTTPTAAADLNFGDPKLGKGYKASGTSHAQVNLRQDGTLLEGKAIYLDEILALSTVHIPHAEDDIFQVDSQGHAFHFGDIKRQRDWYRETCNLVNLHAHPPLKTRADLEEAFWRTLCGDTEVTSRPAPSEFGTYYASMIEVWNSWDTFIQEDGTLKVVPEDEKFWDLIGNANRWGSAMGQGCSMRRFCVTREGYIGLVPPHVEVGDVIWVFLGAPTPYVLRHKPPGKSQGGEAAERAYQLVGECYVDEMMDGEIFEMQRKAESVVLV